MRITNTPPAFTNCIIRNNSSPTHGGGILAKVEGRPLLIVGCTISNNVAAPSELDIDIYGGGIYVDGSLSLAQSTVVNNRTWGYDGFGAGVFAWNGDCTMRSCTFAFNSSNGRRENAVGVYFNGGAVGGSLNMANCIMSTNGIVGAATYYGAGGLLSYGKAKLVNCISVGNAHGGFRFPSGQASVINCTVIANAPGFMGILSDGAVVAVTNSILYFNNSGLAQFAGNVTFAYSDVQGGVRPGPGNISFSPGLCPSQTLIQGSPCIDSGSSDPTFNDACLDNIGTCSPFSRGTTRNDMGAYGGLGSCCWSSPCGGVITIVSEPKALTACISSTAILCVSAIGDQPISYQWRFHGVNGNNAPTDVIGGTNSCLIISNVQSNNAGYYSVRVANSFSAALSSSALLTVTPVCVDINLYAGLSLTGGFVGSIYRVQYVTDLNDTSWTTLTTVTQKVSGVFVLDPQPANQQHRFYRVVP